MSDIETTTQTLSIESTEFGRVGVTFTERGTGQPVLILHGGAGPLSVTHFADLLAGRQPARVLTPSHPGFGGTERPDSLETPRQLAALYVAFLDELDLRDVTVIGHSLGGWIAGEIAILASPRVGRIILVDAVGAEVAGHPVIDLFSLSMAEVAHYSYFDPSKFTLDVSALPPAALAVFAANRVALSVYGGEGMTDPTLLARLGSVAVPTLVLWGEGDRVVVPEVGRALAAAIPGARFELMLGTGHVPQVETPEVLQVAVMPFLSEG